LENQQEEFLHRREEFHLTPLEILVVQDKIQQLEATRQREEMLLQVQEETLLLKEEIM
tara:strand:- start:443 stop:616 length:174 start_codon:yes stop_codon:yes gene_type:complete